MILLPPWRFALLLGVLCCAETVCAFEPIIRLPATDAFLGSELIADSQYVDSQLVDSQSTILQPSVLDAETLHSSEFQTDQFQGAPWNDYQSGFGPDSMPFPNEMGEWLPPATGQLPTHKPGSFFQKVSAATTHLHASDTQNDIRITEIELLSTFAVPLPTSEHPLLISPNFETRFLAGPLAPDVPAQLYSAFAQFIWVPRLTKNWTLILGIEPGVYSDFETSDDAFRLLGRALARYEWRAARMEIIAGALYLDRDDVPILPAGGIIWIPTDNWKLELIFPTPRVGYRYAFDGRAEKWLYVAGEFGGDTWAVQRASGVSDRITLRDFRVSAGWEKRFAGGAGARYEVGYVFGRTLEYDSVANEIELPSTIMFRGVLSY